MNLAMRNLLVLCLTFHLIFPTLQHILECAEFRGSRVIVGLVVMPQFVIPAPICNNTCLNI